MTVTIKLDNIQKFESLAKFLSTIENVDRNSIVLYRGQSCDMPLLPKIARDVPGCDTIGREKEMLNELRRIGSSFLPDVNENDWDLLARAQHFRLATRLLDWTTNPLVGLWFAVCDLDEAKDSFLYMFHPTGEDLVRKPRDSDPFAAGRTLVYRPNFRNARILAQSGWFTLHRFSRQSNRFVPLEQNEKLKNKILRWEIPGRKKSQIVSQLDRLGVNHQSLFPDLEGVCRHLNWVHRV